VAFPPSSAAKVLLWGNVRFIAGAHFSGTAPLVTSDRSERSWWLSQFSRIDSTKFNMYPLVMTNSLRTGKIHPFLRTVNHLFRLGPCIYHGYVSHNQMIHHCTSRNHGYPPAQSPGSILGPGLGKLCRPRGFLLDAFTHQSSSM